jgi:molybdenum ABC transporter molybdate-binding protein
MRAHRWVPFLASLALLAGLLWWAVRGEPASPRTASLVVFCAAGIRVPVEAAAQEYEKAQGVLVQLQYGGSQTLLANIEIARKGDLYIPADDAYLRAAREKGLGAESVALARMTPVLAVRKGNPKGIRSLDDLGRGGVKLVQANPEAAAVGKLVREDLEKSGRWAAVKQGTTAFKPTVNEVANDLKLGLADAGFVWDATVEQYPELEAVAAFGRPAQMPAVVLTTAADPAAALRFARFLAASGEAFRKAGFQPAESDAWEESPRLLFYAGAMLRPAIEKTLTAFERREGCRITRVYNGCGILVGQMKAGERPDLYFACDESFMKEVKDLFLDPAPVSMNQLVILVRKGNPHGVKTLKDLGKPGLKVGIGHEKQCALGVLTQETLLQTGLRKEVMKNVVVEVPAGDMLVNQMRAGTLDAVVAYVSNATGSADALEALPVDVPCALATQPLAVGRGSKHRQISSRLVEALRSVESRRAFESEGFRWKAAP